MKKLLTVLGLAVVAAGLWAGGAAEGSSAARGVYLAGRGVIVPPQEIVESSFIGSVDYAYPEPVGVYGVSAHAATRQISSAGQELLVVVGVQSRHDDFSELPPLNLAFVIDRSGSMASQDKLSWVKESFDVFIDSVRSEDFVSLVVFDSAAQVVFPSTQVAGKREKFREIVHSLTTGGGTNLRAGMELGYEQVMANYRKEYTNRVLFLTDGRGDAAELEQMAAGYREAGITLSTIGLGQDFDMELMRSLASHGGGSSRFISGREEMKDAFGHGLGRMAVRVAEDLEVSIDLAAGVSLVESWGYDVSAAAGRVVCRYPGLHLGDYETAILRLHVDRRGPGPFTVAEIASTYAGDAGRRREGHGTRLTVEVVDREVPVDGISDAVVLRAGTILAFARELKEIGERYYTAVQAAAFDGAASRTLIERTNSIRKQLINARARLDDVGFDDEIAILDDYLGILGGEAKMDAGELDSIRADREIPPAAPGVPLVQRLEGLFAEVALDLRGQGAGRIAVSGFARSDGKPSSMTELLDNLAAAALSESFTLVERIRLEAVLREQQLSLSDLMETEEAIRVGRFLAADYILTGTVVPMQSSVVVFTRVIHSETGEIRSAAQVIVPVDAEIRTLM